MAISKREVSIFDLNGSRSHGIGKQFMTALCYIHLLGGLRVQQAERALTRFRTQKTAVLLAYLAYYPRRAHPREVLIDLLWPTLDPNDGRNNLSTALSSLRHQLEPPGVPTGAVLIADRQSVRMNPDAITTDVADFESHLRLAEQAQSETERGRCLQDALAYYDGPLMPGFYEEWIRAERERLAEAYQQAVRRLARCLAQAGELAQAIDHVQRAIGMEPLREAAHRDLMRLYMASGQASLARQQYHILEELLRQELGERPSPTTRQLYQKIYSREEEIESRKQGEQAGKMHRTREKQDARSEETMAHGLATSGAVLSGTLTFLLSDIVGSTAGQPQRDDVSKKALDALTDVLGREIQQHGGYVFKQADTFLGVAFQSAFDALECAVAAQRSLAVQTGTEEGTPRVRMALHTGDLQGAKGEDHTRVLNQTIRLLTAGNAGQILCSEVTAGLLRYDPLPGVRLVDLGIFRLRDMPAPERLFQVEYPGMPKQVFTPLRAEAGYEVHLPLQFTRFFGRKQEIAQLLALLQVHSSSPRLITLTGPGGIGKTRLAIEAARRAVQDFSGAVRFVPLADIFQPQLLPCALLNALSLPCSSSPDPLEQVIQMLSPRPSLLVLDNFECLIAGGTDLVRILLERVPLLTCLVTSRQRLELAGEHEFAVPPLPVPASAGTPEQMSLYESVQLFLDRAQTAKPDFQMTAANAAALAELCARLEGIPLAIELAASRALVMTPAQMLSQLAHRFEFLVSRRRDIAERHRTLRAAIDWSYRLLAPELGRFFMRLSIFRGGWSLEAAEAICEEPMALDYLAQLRECSLIETLDRGMEIRFRMLETLREYAWERLLESGESQTIRGRHLNYFLALAEKIEPQLSGAAQGRALDLLEADHDNLRAALEGCEVDESSAEMGLRLAASLTRFWHVRGHLSEGRMHFDGLLSKVAAREPTEIRAKALGKAGFLAFYQGDYAAARNLFAESLEIYRELDMQQHIAGALNALGLAVSYQGDYTLARSCYEESLTINRKLGDKNVLAPTLGNFGTLARRYGDYALARSLLEECLTIRRETGTLEQVAVALNNLGLVVQNQGDYATARVLLEESLALRRQSGDRWRIAVALEGLGNLDHAEGDHRSAYARYSESLAICRGLGHKQDTSRMLRGMAGVVRDEGDYGAAHTFLEESLRISRELGDKPGIAGSLDSLALLAVKEGQMVRAARLFGAVETLRRSIGLSLAPDEQVEHERGIATARVLLGEAAWKTAWAAGQAMAPEQAMEYALTFIKDES